MSDTLSQSVAEKIKDFPLNVARQGLFRTEPKEAPVFHGVVDKIRDMTNNYLINMGVMGGLRPTIGSAMAATLAQ